MKHSITSIKMDQPYTTFIVGGQGDKQATLQSKLKPVKMDSKISLAITSLFKGQVFTVS